MMPSDCGFIKKTIEEYGEISISDLWELAKTSMTIERFLNSVANSVRNKYIMSSDVGFAVRPPTKDEFADGQRRRTERQHILIKAKEIFEAAEKIRKKDGLLGAAKIDKIVIDSMERLKSADRKVIAIDAASHGHPLTRSELANSTKRLSIKGNISKLAGSIKYHFISSDLSWRDKHNAARRQTLLRRFEEKRVNKTKSGLRGKEWVKTGLAISVPSNLEQAVINIGLILSGIQNRLDRIESDRNAKMPIPTSVEAKY